MPDITTYIIVIALVILSGIFSGLTLGLMSLDIYELKRKIKLGNEQAKKVYPIRKSGNLLLSTLLIGNVAVNSALSIFLGSIASGIIAGLVATTLIVIFGEILPQSLFSRYALAVGANTTWIVYIFIVILYPVTKPIAMILDKFLGAELPTVYSKKEFQEILAEQRDMKKSSITHDDYQILSGGLEYSKKTVTEVMTPRVNTYFIKRSERLTRGKIKEILEVGHSRIPVISANQEKVVGILYTKDLISIDPDDNTPVSKVMRNKVHTISEDAKLRRVLNKFKRERMHLFIVHDEFNGIAGIITLEDVIEEILGEIVDEYDSHVDMRKANVR